VGMVITASTRRSALKEIIDDYRDEAYFMRKKATAMVQQSARHVWPWYTWAILVVALAILVRVGLGVLQTLTPAQPSESATAAAGVAGGITQTNEGGQVTIKASWQGPSAGPVFAVAMDTHAVDLDSYDLKQLAVLRIDGGREVQPIGWDAPKGGHHRSGTLTFPATATDGSALIVPGTRRLQLVIRDVAGVPERVFRWTL